jgi:hypothetical protein
MQAGFSRDGHPDALCLLIGRSWQLLLRLIARFSIFWAQFFRARLRSCRSLRSSVLSCHLRQYSQPPRNSIAVAINRPQTANRFVIFVLPILRFRSSFREADGKPLFTVRHRGTTRRWLMAPTKRTSPAGSGETWISVLGMGEIRIRSLPEPSPA